MTDSIQTLIAAVEQADSPAQLIGAVRALAAARSSEAIPTLIQALGYNNPGAAVAAVAGLTQLGEAAVQPILEQLDDYDYGARAYAVRALAAIADPRALEVLLAAAETDFAPSVRRAAIKGIGSIRWQQASAAADRAKALKTLLLVAEDADWAIRYAAVVGLQALATAAEPETRRAIDDRLHEMAQTELEAATQARVWLAQQQLQSAPPASGNPPLAHPLFT